MRRFRLSVTPALVVSALALLVSLSGTAMAAVIISSNSQVARNTIAGHATIRGVHANLIAGSIVSTDMSSAYKARLKVHCPARLLAVGDICVESAVRGPASYVSALATCASVGRRLPNDAELALAMTGLGAPQTTQWTAGHSYYGTTDGAGTVEENADRSLVFGWASLSAMVNFRCIVSPHN
jgi:hypothetical protein